MWTLFMDFLSVQGKSHPGAGGGEDDRDTATAGQDQQRKEGNHWRQRSDRRKHQWQQQTPQKKKWRQTPVQLLHGAIPRKHFLWAFFLSSFLPFFLLAWGPRHPRSRLVAGRSQCPSSRRDAKHCILTLVLPAHFLFFYFFSFSFHAWVSPSVGVVWPRPYYGISCPPSPRPGLLGSASPHWSPS